MFYYTQNDTIVPFIVSNRLALTLSICMQQQVFKPKSSVLRVQQVDELQKIASRMH